MKKIYTLVFLFILASTGLFAQKEAYTWAFGYRAGLDFNNLRTTSFQATRLHPSTGTAYISNLPSAITTAITTYEGCFSLSDATTGQLMFYSDGQTIFKADGSVMTNGDNLIGHVSSTQSGVLMPFPGNPNKYIVLSIGLIDASTRVVYSVIDMSDGTGKVLNKSPFLKNTPLTGHRGDLGESVNVIQHGNKKDFWIVAPGSGTNSALNAWLVTKDGIQASSPVVTPFSASQVASDNTYFKFSPDGKHFVWCNNLSLNPFWFGDFDKNTGEFSNIQMGNAYFSEGALGGTYSAEFSQSGKYLYVSTGSTINAYNYVSLAANPSGYSPALYAMTGGDTDSETKNSLAVGSLQLGPDGYIYGTYYDRFKSPSHDLGNLTIGSRRYMILITNPENPMNLNIYRLDDFLNAGTGGHVGITSFSPSWFSLEIDGETSFCTDAVSTTIKSYSINLAGTATSKPTKLQWYFDYDNYPTSYTEQTVSSTDMTLSKNASFAPVTTVTTRKIVVKAFNGSTELTDLEQSLTVTLYPAASVSAANQSVSSGSTATLTATASAGATISWYSAATGGTLLGTGATYTTGAITTETSFYVEAANPACSSGRQEVKVTISISAPTIDVSDPVAICAGSTATLTATVSAGANAYWFLTPTGGSPVMTGTSVTTPALDYTTMYYVEAQNSGNIPSERKAVKVTVNPCTLAVNPNIHLIN
ncbi:hypothetical protein D0T84_19730 [Dysgonomonas sp. 521]|uniref:immunoglobulin domain-containing protein n=1 Tax=Dysgonomonas sp. 521 TaxID=2302932 RepID=UPI0013D5993D|nr:hypothetical protein [Dysgonomonas sp. 521]NDV97114.1 hypothetical protein [Dysgonomonas sp. 521]